MADQIQRDMKTRLFDCYKEELSFIVNRLLYRNQQHTTIDIGTKFKIDSWRFLGRSLLLFFISPVISLAIIGFAIKVGLSKSKKDIPWAKTLLTAIAAPPYCLLILSLTLPLVPLNIINNALIACNIVYTKLLPNIFPHKKDQSIVRTDPANMPPLAHPQPHGPDTAVDPELFDVFKNIYLQNITLSMRISEIEPNCKTELLQQLEQAVQALDDTSRQPKELGAFITQYANWQCFKLSIIEHYDYDESMKQELNSLQEDFNTLYKHGIEHPDDMDYVVLVKSDITSNSLPTNIIERARALLTYYLSEIAENIEHTNPSSGPTQP